MKIKNIITHILLILFGILMIYPLIWLFFASFKDNADIFSSMKLLPTKFIWSSYAEGWKGSGQYSFGVFLMNSLKLVVPTVAFTLISCTSVAYGFARFDFPFRKPLFLLMLSTLMLPASVLIIPRYMLFKNLGWLNSYNPFIIPAAFACYPFFIYMLVQFFRGIPKELEESARIDGCNALTILIRIFLPLSKPALISAGLFQFIWTWNDFFNTLIYINGVEKFPVSLGLRMSIDSMSAVSWNKIMAMSIVAMLPCILIFFLAQKYFVEGIATTGLKG